MDIRSCKISTTKDKSASRSGLAALAEPVRKLGLDARFERLMPEPGSSRGLRPGAQPATFMLMMHEGSRHLSAVAQLREEMPLIAVALHHRKTAALDIDATAALREVFGGVRL